MEQEATPGKNENLFVGIDLGTSSSAIVASNGIKNWIESYVGWPKDFIAAKVVKKPILFGMEAIKNRLSLDIRKPLEHGVIKEGTEKDEESVKELIRHLISLVKPDPNQKVLAVVGVPAESFKINRMAIRDAVSDFVHSIIVVSEPFAVAYGMNLLNNALIIDIGAGTVDFCIMHGTIPLEEDQRTILTAGDYIDQHLFNLLKDKHPESAFNLNMVRSFKEENSFVGNSQSPVKVKIPVEGKPTIHNITDEIKKSCESVFPPIIETLAEMIAKFDPEYQNKIRNNIVIAGCGSQIRGIREYLEDSMKEYGHCQVKIVDDPLFVGANGALTMAQEMPRDYWEKLSKI